MSEVFGGGLPQILISVQNTLSLMQSFVNTLTKIPDINDHILQLDSQFWSFNLILKRSILSRPTSNPQGIKLFERNSMFRPVWNNFIEEAFFRSYRPLNGLQLWIWPRRSPWNSRLSFWTSSTNFLPEVKRNFEKTFSPSRSSKSNSHSYKLQLPDFLCTQFTSENDRDYKRLGEFKQLWAVQTSFKQLQSVCGHLRCFLLNKNR